MKARLFVALGLALGASSLALAGARVMLPNPMGSSPAHVSRTKDHPLAQPISNSDVRIDITYDNVLRSCCKYPDLVVSGKVTNLTHEPIKYVRLVIAMKDAKGQVVYTDDTYNHGAVTLFEDPRIAKLLNEKRHFEPMGPGTSDTFVFQIPMPLLPRYKSEVVLAANVARENSVTQSQ